MKGLWNLLSPSRIPTVVAGSILIATGCAPALAQLPPIALRFDTCPQNDPAHNAIRADFEIRRDGQIAASPKCTEPPSQMALNDYSDELLAIQVLRVAYYMDLGRSNYLPWTPLRFYDWMKSKLAGVNISTTSANASCCTVIAGRKYMTLPVTRDDLNRAFKLTFKGVTANLALFGHESRHVDGYLHSSGCGITAGCDPNYDETNLSAYGIQYWLFRAWLNGTIDLGFSCLPPVESTDLAAWYLNAANGYLGRFDGTKPPPVTMPAKPGGPCSASSAALPQTFLPIAPCRLVDTRNPAGPLGGPFIQAQSTRNFPVRSACGLPASSAAYSVNVTVVPRGLLGFVTIWPGGKPQPVVSTLNSLDGRIKANAAIVPAGADGSVNVYATEATDVIIDVSGAFAPQASNPAGQSFYSLTPCRIYDSRIAGGALQAQVNRVVPVAGASGCGVPVTASAYVLNFTVVPRQPLGFLTLWPNNGSTRPVASTLNALTGTVTANLAIVPAGNAGDINAYATDASELIVDVMGYFGPPGGVGALKFYPLDPCRVLDTRLPNGPLGGPEQNLSVRSYPVMSSSCGIPSTALAYSANATVVPPAILGFLTLFPMGVTRPVASTLNAVDGAITSNAMMVPAGAGGQISAYVTERTHLILDINGYFAP